jgi:hypothetical protein
MCVCKNIAGGIWMGEGWNRNELHRVHSTEINESTVYLNQAPPKIQSTTI